MTAAFSATFSFHRINQLKAKVLHVLLVFGFTSSVSFGNIIYVKSSGNNTNTGDSWASALAGVQNALDAAAEGDTVLVAEGTYKPTESPDPNLSGRHRAFHIHDKNIVLWGGYVVGDQPGYPTGSFQKTILSGDVGTANNSMDNSYHVLVMSDLSSQFKIKGFTIEDGENGPTFSTITFDNKAISVESGGGMYLDNCSMIMENILFRHSVAHRGGALHTDGCAVTCVNITFLDNSASFIGGAIHDIGGSSNIYQNVNFIRNEANNSGGAMYNSTGTHTLINTNFIEDTAGTSGGAIENEENTFTNLYNSFFFGNMAPSNPEISPFGTPVNGSHNAVSRNGSSIANMPSSFYTGADPFLDLTNLPGTDGTWHTADDGLLHKPSSILINKGSNAWAATADIIEAPRIVSSTIDIGPYEYQCGRAGIIYVDTNAAGNNFGGDWKNAFTNLQVAIDFAQDCHPSSTPEIWVAAGTYVPSKEFDADGSGGSDAREKTFYISKDLRLLGGFGGYPDGNESGPQDRNWNTHPTILSGELGGAGNTDNAYHVVFIDGTQSTNIYAACVLDGFQITDGNANSTGINSRGGGIYNHGEGAGNACNPSILNVEFFNNLAATGGAIHNNGFNGDCSPTIQNSLFYQNSASDRGGAIFNNGNSGNCEPKIICTTLSKNSAGFGGGAIYNFGSVTGNCSVEVSNTILWNNQDEIENADATTNLYYSIFDDGSPDYNFTNPSFQGAFNFDQDPQFMDAGNNDYRLQVGSPAINAGIVDTSGLMLPVYDLAHGSRMKSRLDVGAYESQQDNCQSSLALTAIDNPLYKTYQASGQIEVSQGQIPAWSHAILDAPNVIVNANTEVALGSIFEIQKDGCNN